MGLFNSLGWFKSQKQKEMEDLQLEAAKIQVSILQKKSAQLDAHKAPLQLSSGKPYKTIKLVDDKLTIVLLDGNIITKHNATAEDFQKARNVANEQELLKMAPSSQYLEEVKEQEAKVKKQRDIIQGIETL